jgi:hypothetical protein
MSQKSGDTQIVFKLEIKDTVYQKAHAAGKKIYFFPKSIEHEIPRIFRAAIVHPHPEKYEEDFAKSFVMLQEAKFKELRTIPQHRGGDESLIARAGLSRPVGVDGWVRQDVISHKLTSTYGQYVSIIPLLVSQRTNKKKTEKAFALLPEKIRETTNLAAAPYYASLKRMARSHAYLVYKGQVCKPICSVCAFVTLGISGDCHPMGDACRERMSIPGLSIAEEINKLTEQRVQQCEGDFFNDHLLSEPDEPLGVLNYPESGPAAGDRRHDTVVSPGDQQLGDVVADTRS